MFIFNLTQTRTYSLEDKELVEPQVSSPSYAAAGVPFVNNGAEILRTKLEFIIVNEHIYPSVPILLFASSHQHYTSNQLITGEGKPQTCA